MTDKYTDDLFSFCSTRVVFGLSRLLCDVERLRDPELEEMTKKGMWICYTHCHNGEALKQVSDTHRDEMLALYDAHHKALTDAVDEALKGGECLIIDCHSFSSSRLPYETAEEGERPDICIGTDPYHTPERLWKELHRRFTARVKNDLKKIIADI